MHQRCTELNQYVQKVDEMTTKETKKTRSPYATTYHRDGSVTVWDVYTQGWVRTGRPSDRILASCSSDRERIKRHCGA